MNQDIAQANIDAAHDLEERFHRDWDQLWDEAGLFINSRKGFAWRFYQTLSRERPFSCVNCGRAMSYASLIYSNVPLDKHALETVTCFPCNQLAEARRSLTGQAVTA
jgi:hypothetical protein